MNMCFIRACQPDLIFADYQVQMSHNHPAEAFKTHIGQWVCYWTNLDCSITSESIKIFVSCCPNSVYGECGVNFVNIVNIANIVNTIFEIPKYFEIQEFFSDPGVFLDPGPL